MGAKIICEGSSVVTKGDFIDAAGKCQSMGRRIKTHFNKSDIEASLAEMDATLVGQDPPLPRVSRQFWTGEKFIGFVTIKLQE